MNPEQPDFDKNEEIVTSEVQQLIDERTAIFNEEITAFQDDLGRLKGRIGNLDEGIEFLAKQINKHTARIEHLEAQLEAAEVDEKEDIRQKITQTEGWRSQIRERAEELVDQLGELKERTTQVADHITSRQVRIQTLATSKGDYIGDN